MAAPSSVVGRGDKRKASAAAGSEIQARKQKRQIMDERMNWLYCLVGCYRSLHYYDPTVTWLLHGCNSLGNLQEVLKGQVVWVTGASSGIGEALASKLASVGCHLVLSTRREDKLHALKQKFVERGYGTPEEYLVLHLDLLDYDSHIGSVETELKYFKKIDCLVNNEGWSQRAVITKTSFAIDQQMLAVNINIID